MTERRKLEGAVRRRNREVFLADTDRREQTCHRMTTRRPT
jgi:hypothetical protein